MKIGIVSVLYKSDSVIEDYIESLNRQSFSDFEVLYIENDVTNRYCQQVIEEKSKYPFHFIRNAENVGIATGNNQGIDYFDDRNDCDFILFMNNDVEFDSDFLQKHCEYHDRFGLDIIVPKILYHDSQKIWYAGGSLSYLKGGPRHWGHNKKDRLQDQGYFAVDYAPTCSFLIKKDLLIKNNIRMWDQLFVYYDDYQFCLDIKKAGLTIYYVPELTLLHKISSSTGGAESPFSRRFLTRNKFYLMRRHKNLMFLQTPAALLYYSLSGRSIETKAILESLKMA